MAARAPHGTNQPPKIVIVKKIIEGGHGAHHGGAWKVAYADFVTAMMAFFLLLWLLGATTEKQRKGIADYFAPTIIDTRALGMGGSGLFGGESVLSDQKIGEKAGRSSEQGLATPVTGAGGNKPGTGDKGSLRNEDRKNFERMRGDVQKAMQASTELRKLAPQVKFVMTTEGMRIDLVDNADYSMFALGTTALAPEASALIGRIATAITGTGNTIMIRGHTDAVPWGDPRAMNNWMLSSGRAEATRRRLALGGIAEPRFARIEGVADREPMVKDAPTDPRNRRVAITLLYRRGGFGS
ncbi:MAG: flagellar motor protein [Sphingomonas bacterium]|uniref:flagellar motor protein MotB n=1 Tax=Sphingomonas bacterium TaxID=1895847 RepID=UPI002632EB36|nr:flagellar motor protein MotB [Sphingomonas bacterium]MDB5695009.1 flagellar motor protein [Sphingomonas bacterium]